MKDFDLDYHAYNWSLTRKAELYLSLGSAPNLNMVIENGELLFLTTQHDPNEYLPH